jgi:hypothetical protein
MILKDSPLLIVKENPMQWNVEEKITRALFLFKK